MPAMIEDYALIGDMQSAAMVSRDGSVDWLCLPRFDSAACFAALLGTGRNGYWRIAPAGIAGEQAGPTRRYQGETLVLETDWQAAGGRVRVTDFMPPRDGKPPALVRIVEGLAGSVDVACEFRVRFGYGQVVPWMRRVGGRVLGVAGPDALWLDTPVPLTGRGFTHQATFTVRAGERVPFTLSWVPSRDATITLEALLRTGYTEEALAWRDWLCRAVAGDPADVQIMYGVAGERRLAEWEADWLPGYEDSAPVRIGNAAVNQRQLDVYGEVIDALTLGRRSGIAVDRHSWALQRALLGFLEKHWDEPDEGIWEVRGPRRHFVHSKVMAWVAFDRAAGIAASGQDGAADRWRAIADRIHQQVCEQGFNTERGAFTQYYGASQLDAAVLLIPEVGFLPATDPRVISTVEAVQRELMTDGLVRRYQLDDAAGTPGSSPDGLPGTEGAFLACSFWLANALHMIGRDDEAAELFERLLTLRNDVGLLSEEYDPRYKRQVGNTPQAFSHVPLIQAALNLDRHAGAHWRGPAGPAPVAPAPGGTAP